MAHSIYMDDGSVEYLFHEEGSQGYYDDFQKLIYEKLGRDAEQVIIELRKAADYTEQKTNTDLGAYEAQLESNTSCFQDILDIVSRLKREIMFSKRLNRTNLENLLNQIITEINNQI